jgi:hypothetical protein
MTDHLKRIIVESQKVFNLRLDRERKWAKKVGLKIETAADNPKQGPFYWLRLGTRTVLKAMPCPANSLESMDHPDFWEAIVDMYIVPFYGIKDARLVRELKNVPYAMPRGRVVMMKRPLDSTKQFVVYSWEKMTNPQKKQVVEEFGLASQFMAGLVRFVPDEHEGIIQADNARFEALVSSKSSRRRET